MNDRNVTLPEFDGTSGITGYLRLFEELAGGLTSDPDCLRRYLLSKLQGAARAWLLSHGDTWGTWDYAELKERLRTHFKGE